MKLVIASDIHGSARWCRALMELVERVHFYGAKISMELIGIFPEGYTVSDHIEALFQDGDLHAASAAASLLAIIGLVSLVCRLASARLHSLAAAQRPPTT